jgi:hypothetical protein
MRGTPCRASAYTGAARPITSGISAGLPLCSPQPHGLSGLLASERDGIVPVWRPCALIVMRVYAAPVRHCDGVQHRAADSHPRAAAGLPPASIAGIPATPPRCGSPPDRVMGPVRRHTADETTTGAAGFSAAPVSSSTRVLRRNAATSTILLMVRELSARVVSRRHYRACNNSTCPAEHRHNNSNRSRTRRGPRSA